jgi:CTP synthase (UTP-ammonia lyase)
VDVVLVEIGGTAGDIESLPFLEAIRQMRLELGAENVVFVHLTLVPYIATAGELKTKPTQHSVKEMLSIGIQPDILICRSDRQLSGDLKAKIALFCNVAESCVISAPDVSNIYEVPMSLASEGLDEQILRLLRLEAPPRDLSPWLAMLETLENPQGEVRIGVVGKYVQLEDAYKSLREAFRTAVSQTASAWSSNGLKPKKSIRPPRLSGVSAIWTGFSFPAASASAALPGWFTPSPTRAKRRFRFSAFAWECSAPRSNMRVRFRNSSAPIAPSSIPERPIA